MGNRKSMDFNEHNKKIAKLRGPSWNEKLRLAKLDASDNPSMLAYVRNRRGLSQRAMLKKLGINTLATYARIERGNNTASLDRANAIAEILNVPRSKIFVKVDRGRFMVI